MNILFDDEKKIFKIDTEHTSYVIAVTDEEGFLGNKDFRYGCKLSASHGRKPVCSI